MSLKHRNQICASRTLVEGAFPWSCTLILPEKVLERSVCHWEMGIDGDESKSMTGLVCSIHKFPVVPLRRQLYLCRKGKERLTSRYLEEGNANQVDYAACWGKGAPFVSFVNREQYGFPYIFTYVVISCNMALGTCVATCFGNCRIYIEIYMYIYIWAEVFSAQVLNSSRTGRRAELVRHLPRGRIRREN